MDARSLSERTLASSAATENARAGAKCNLASSAATGAFAPCKFAYGQASSKKKRHVDCMDDLVRGMMSETSMMADAIKYIASANLKSPTKKR